MRASLFSRAKDFGIVLDDVAITHLSFSTEFTRAVEMKQVAAQDAERAKFVVLKAEQVGCWRWGWWWAGAGAGAAAGGAGGLALGLLLAGLVGLALALSLGLVLLV